MHKIFGLGRLGDSAEVRYHPPTISGNDNVWRLFSIILAPKLTSHACAFLIDNVGNYLYLNNGRFKFVVDPHQFNLRLHHFSQFQRKKTILKSWQVCDWLAKWLIILGFMDLRWPRVYRRSDVGLVIVFKRCLNVAVLFLWYGFTLT